METKKFLSLLKHENLTYTEQNFEKGFTETIMIVTILSFNCMAMHSFNIWTWLVLVMVKCTLVNCLTECVATQ